MGTQSLSRYTDGSTVTFQILPWARRLDPLDRFENTVAPTISGTAGAGNTVTVVAGTYNQPWTVIGYVFTQSDSDSVIKTGTGTSFILASSPEITTYSVVETVIDVHGRTATGTSTTYSCPAVANAPQITAAPTLSPTGGAVGTAITMTYGAVTGAPTPTNTRRWLLSTTSTGTKTATGITASTYTPATAEVSKYLWGEQTATNTVGSAVRLSAPVVIVGTAGVYASPTTQQEFQDALNNAPGGSIIETPLGNAIYQWRLLSTTTKDRSANPIIIRPRDRGNPTKFVHNTNGQPVLDLGYWHGITIDGINFVADWTDSQDNLKPLCLLNRGGKKWTLTNCTFDGWFGAYETHNNVTGGANVPTDDCTISYCEVKNMLCDGFRIYNLGTNGWIHHNKIWQTAINTSWTNGAAGGRHPDFIQLASTSSYTGTTNLIIEDNYLHSTQTSAEFSQGIHGVLILAENVMAETYTLSGGYGHKNITVRRNDIFGATSEGIACAGVKGATISGNRMRRNPTSPTTEFQTPQVYMVISNRAGNIHRVWAEDIVVSNNAWPIIGGQSALNYGPGDPLPADGGSLSITKSGNIDVATGDPVGWSGFDVAKGIYGPYGAG